MNEAIISQSAMPPAERLHPLYLLTGLGKSVRGAWGLLAGGAVLASRSQWWLAAAMLGGFMLLSIGGLFLKWLKFEYRVGRDEIRIDTGFLNRSSRVIPFDRVTDIDIEQGPAHRLLGLARVRFETGASAGAKTDDGVLETIALDRAEALRNHIRYRKGGADQQLAPATDAEVAPIFAMGPRRVALAGLFNFSLAIIAGLFGATQTLGNMVGFDPFKRSFWERALSEVAPVRDLVVAHQYLSALAGLLSLTAIGVATGIVRTGLREHGFRLDRAESGLRRRRGLITLTDVSLPARRVQAAILATGPVRRRFGWWTLKLQSLAQDGGQGDHVVAPLATCEEATVVNSSIGLPTASQNDAWRPVSKAYIWSNAPVLVLLTLGSALGLAAGKPLAMAGLLVVGVLAALRYASWRHTRYALDGAHLFIERGWWRHHRLILPLRRIQSVDLSENAWTRRLGYCALQLGVAGGSGLAIHAIPALARVDAEHLRGQLLNP